MRPMWTIGLTMGLLVTGGDLWAASVSVDQSGQRFSERSVKVKAGDTVIFANHDDVTHNIGVTGDDDEVTDLGLQKPGQLLSHRFDKAGRTKVRCSIHPGMKMTIDVE